MGRARETANRVKCASNLKQIGLAALLYSHESGGELPPDLYTLYLHSDLDSYAFVCPSHDVEPSPGATRDAVVACWLSGDHLGYVWVGSKRKVIDVGADEVIAFDLEHHVPKDGAIGRGMNVLYGDGRVEFVDEKTAKRIWAQFFSGVRPIRVMDPMPTTAGSQPAP
jgi:prepilin-type processing-associated H-X9-DG protein